MNLRHAILEIDTLGEVVVDRFTGTEAINALQAFDVTVHVDDPALSLDDMLGADARLVFADDDGAERRIPLMIEAASFEGETTAGFAYAFKLTSRLALLTRRSGYRIFLDQSVLEIVSEVLRDAGTPEETVQWRLSEQLHARAQCVQYDECEWNFIARLLADEGINAWHERTDDAAVLILGDGPASHDEVGGGAFGFDDASGLKRTIQAFFSFERTYAMAPEAACVREYDIDQPEVPIDGKSGEGWLEHFEYPAWVADADAAGRRATVRLEQLRRDADVTTAATHSSRLIPGRYIHVADMPDADLDGDYLVVEVAHSYSQEGVGHDKHGHYTARGVLVPHGEHAFRPAAPERVPRMDGIESATVTGPAGEEIHVDDLGRIKLATRWDPSGKRDDRTSAWSRTTQMNMDGSMLLPRVGFEMAIAYRDGRPDMPVALGKLYNGKNRTPYNLPARMATASLMSGTSPGGGSVNEIRLSDDAGCQSFAVQASGDQGLTAGGDATISVAANEAHNVKGNLTEHIEGAQTISISGNQTITAGAAHATKVDARSVSVGGDENVGVDQSRIIDCGVYTEAVGGLYFTQCNTAAETCKASFMQTVGGALGVAAGCGTAESVLGARSEVCGGPRIVAAGMFEDKTYGAKLIQCGANALTAASKIVHNVKSAAVINAGSTSFSAGGTVAIKASGSVTITAGSLLVNGGSSYALAGAHSASADINLDNSTVSYQLTKASS